MKMSQFGGQKTKHRGKPLAGIGFALLKPVVARMSLLKNRV
jgi:hypothetical protein